MQIFKSKFSDPSAIHMPGVIVLGSPRSGTTLLRRLLNTHSDISCPGETFLFKGAARFLEADDISNGFDYGVLGALEGLGFEREDILSRLRHFVTGFYEELATKDGKKLWAAKTAIDSFYLKELETLFAGHVNFLIVLRHGLDVVCSMEEFSRDLYSYISELHSYIQIHQRPHDAFAHAWCDITNDLLDFAERHPESCHVVRYEDLTANAAEQMKDITDFLSLPPLEEDAFSTLGQQKLDGIGDWKSYKKSTIDQGSVARWESLPAPVIERLAPVVNATLERCGYDPVAGGDDEDAKRRMELAKMMMRSES